MSARNSRYETSRQAEPPPRKPSNIAKLAVFVGTAYLALGEYLRILEPDVTVACDVQGELDKLVIDPAYRDRVHLAPVGRGHTMHTLFADATPEEQAVIADRPGAPVRYGCSQVRVAGGVAMKQITQGASWQRLVRQQVIPQLLYQVGGACEGIELHLYVGTSGGMGSRGGKVAVRAVVKALLLDTDANIDVHVHLIGAVTFNSPGFDRCRENSSEAVIDWLDFGSRRMNNRVEVVLHLTELSPVGIDKGRRDQLTIDGVQAALAPQLDREHYFKASNATFSGEYGNVRLARTGHYRPLSAGRIAADAADQYLPEVMRTMATRPDLGRIKSLDWFLDSESLPHESAEGILERVHDADAEELLASALQPAARIVATAKLRVKDGRTLNLGDVAATFATPLSAVGETRDRICLLKTCRHALAAQRDELAVQVDQLHLELDKATRCLHFAILEAQGLTWRGLLRSDETKTRRLHQATMAVHALVAELVEAQAKLTAARTALRDLKEVLRQLLTKLKRLRRLLRRCLPQGDSQRLPAAVVPVSVNDFWKRLLGFAEEARADLGHLQHLLAQAVQFVLPEGLATIVGAADASFDAIVRSVDAQTYLQLGPAWGGQEWDQPGSTWLVYPPVDERTAQAILAHHAALPGPPQQIAFAKTALGSVNVVSLEIRYCQRRDDAWTMFYQQGHQRALASERPGFYVCDPAAAERLGINSPPGDQQEKA